MALADEATEHGDAEAAEAAEVAVVVAAGAGATATVETSVSLGAGACVSGLRRAATCAPCCFSRKSGGAAPVKHCFA